MAEEKRSIPVKLIALVVVLGVALALSFIDGRARADCQARFDRAEQALTEGQSLDDVTIAEWMGKAPARFYDGENKRYFEEYDFRGTVRKRTIVVEYVRGATKLVNAVSVK